MEEKTEDLFPLGCWIQLLGTDKGGDSLPCTGVSTGLQRSGVTLKEGRAQRERREKPEVKKE